VLLLVIAQGIYQIQNTHIPHHFSGDSHFNDPHVKEESEQTVVHRCAVLSTELECCTVASLRVSELVFKVTAAVSEHPSFASAANTKNTSYLFTFLRFAGGEDIAIIIMASSKKREAETDLRERARHLFALCDKEEKGFVARRDMQVVVLLFSFKNNSFKLAVAS